MQAKNKNNTVDDNFEALSNLIADPMVIIDCTGKLLAANLSVKEATGFDPKELVGKKFLELDFLDTENKPILARNFEKRMKGFDIEPYEVKITAKNGGAKYFEVKGKRIEYLGELVNLVVFHDVTQRKRFQEQLETNLSESEEKLTSLAKFPSENPNPVVRIAKDGTVLYANAAAKSQLSRLKVEVGQPAPPHLRRLVADALNSGLRKEVEIEHGDRIFLLTLAPVTGAAYVNVYGFDVTERKRSEEELQRAEEKFRTIFEGATDGILAADTKTRRFAFANPRICEITGYPKSELLRMGVGDIHPKQDLPYVIDQFTKQVQGKTALAKDIPVLRKDERIVFCDVNSKTVRISGKNYLVGFFRDMTERRKTEEQIRRAAEEWKKTFDAISDSVFVLDKENRFTAANKALCDFLRKEPKELIGKRCYEVLHGADEPLPDCPCVKAKVTRKPEAIEKADPHSGLWFLLSVWPLFDENDEYAGCVHIVKDITERKDAEEKLKKLKAFDERIIDSLGEALLVIDPDDYRIINVNKEALKQLILRREDLIGKTCYEATHHRSTPCQAPEHICPIRKMLETGSPVTVEHTHFAHQNNEVNVEVSAYPVTDPEGKTAVIHVAKDITERKLMEQAVRDSEEKFRTISNSTKDALILVDGDGRIVFWNPSAEKIFGYTREEALGKEVHKLVVPEVCAEGRDVIELGFKDFAETGKGAFVGKTVELVARRKDGTEFPLKLSLSSMLLKGKWHAVALARDITKQKRVREQLENYSEELEKTVAVRTRELKEAHKRLLTAERFAAIGELAGMVGHDLRNPLTGIKNAAYYLKKRDAYTDGDGRGMIEVIEKAIEHANGIINDLLDYSREIHLELAECSPKSLLRDVLSMIQVPSRIKIFDGTRDEPVIKADCDKVERVFANLIKNAIDAMPGTGTLEISSSQKGQYVEFVFADTGVGMSEKVMAKLFTPLFTTKAQGMGFGLAICKRVVDAHGGIINVDSVAGKGTTFTVALPIEPESEDGGEKTWISTQESLLSTTMKT